MFAFDAEVVSSAHVFCQIFVYFPVLHLLLLLEYQGAHHFFVYFFFQLADDVWNYLQLWLLKFTNIERGLAIMSEVCLALSFSFQNLSHIRLYFSLSLKLDFFDNLLTLIL